ncbi:hypothetical protein Glove_55g60 [Diversispora epigaea]|uniref:TLDc domain-containing protein n=1 Tax=Diversispora epigaea TaxID=1348612 RepID=A0A397JFV9_9GLOM|nr:hypothetical protein Glove_55g60 [Diversispora epigaea]
MVFLVGGLRGSKDDFHPKTFRNMRNGHAGTIVIAKVTGIDERGYNPLAWDNLKIEDAKLETNDSFIFSLKNDNIQNSILSRTKSFGVIINYNAYYEKFIRTTNERFSIEVVKIKRKEKRRNFDIVIIRKKKEKKPWAQTETQIEKNRKTNYKKRGKLSGGKLLFDVACM